MLEDEAIVELFWNREESAIRETDLKYGHYCYSVSYHILFDNLDAQECVSDTWLTAWNKIPPERPKLLQYFLAKITRFLSLNRLRAKTADKRGGGEYEIALSELESVLSAGPTPEEDLVQKDLKDVINDFLWSQKREHRNIFIRRYFYLESAKDIAKKYGLSENNVNVILNRMRSRLKEYLQKEEWM